MMRMREGKCEEHVYIVWAWRDGQVDDIINLTWLAPHELSSRAGSLI